MEKKEQQDIDIREHNFEVILRYALPSTLIFGTLSLCLRYFFHLYEASMITIRIASSIMLLTIFAQFILRFLPLKIKLPGKPIGLIETAIYMFGFTFTLLLIMLFDLD